MLKFKMPKNDDLEIENRVYEDAVGYNRHQTQSKKQINKMTKNAPFEVFLQEDNGNSFSFIVPANTTYLFVENGGLYSCAGKVSINKHLKEFVKTGVLPTNANADVLNEMSLAYVFENIDEIKKVAKLKSKCGYTPTVYTINLEHDMIFIEKLKVGKEMRQRWKDFKESQDANNKSN